MENKRFVCSHGRSIVILRTMKAIIMVVLVGYLLVWIPLPNNVFLQRWSQKIRAKTQSTFFGRQGSNIVVYTFPVLFIATLGSVYLHFGNKDASHNKERNRKKNRFSALRRPLIIKGLGIVSLIELAILLMFIALLIWTFAYFLHSILRFELAKAQREKLWKVKLGGVALTMGALGNVCLTFLFFPVTRGSSVLHLFGLTSEASIKYHTWLGHMTMSLLTAHGVLYVIKWAATYRLSEMLEWRHTNVSNVAGELSLLFGLMLWATTYGGIRRRMFELFFYTHYLYVLFVIFFVFHLGISYACMMLPNFYLFLVDRYLRFLQSRPRVHLVSARILPCETVELNFSKSQGLSYTPTSIIFINVPSISKLQWHPFTVSSNSNMEPELLSVIIRSEGSWSNKLYQMISSSSSVDHLEMSVEGPYGPASTHFLRHDILVMVSGGSGISPFISIIRELMFTSSKLKRKVPRVLLISAFKYSSHLTMLDLILPVSGTPLGPSNLELQIEAYVTREEGPPRENPTLLETIWFKPHPSDAPISPVLGRNNWLWLAAIISSSFIIFLILMGIVTRFYIYPIDHNTNEIFSSSARAALNMLLMCISIVLTASAAFLWNKKQNTMESKQIMGMDRSTHDTDSIEGELESSPHEFFLKSTNVHYGRRPDIRRILSECTGSSVGALVCGPKGMRHDVAAICSSGFIDSLHFESISFGW